jgi:iron(III) transport system ATP-binding protein
MTPVRLEKITKRFGETIALDAVDLEIRAGELFFLLGPSGCGKSTLLRLIAGLHAPSSGKIYFGDRDVTSLGTEKRNAVMCFQSYALWPHMTVRENIAFGLKVRELSAKEQEARISEVLKLVQMEAFAQRRPNQLSGGQQQRVALARALAVQPDCLLLDEPLSNLDTKLRVEMRSEIRRICKSAGCTTIYVTHDQKEAMSVADRIGVMRDGRMQQVGTPAELYYSPTNAFVASFMGATNLIRGRTMGDGAIDTAIGKIVAKNAGTPGREVMLSIRPEQMKIVRGAATLANRVAGKVVESTFLGESSEHVVNVNGERIRVVSSPPAVGINGEIAVEFGADDVVVLSE